MIWRNEARLVSDYLGYFPNVFWYTLNTQYFPVHAVNSAKAQLMSLDLDYPENDLFFGECDSLDEVIASLEEELN